MSKRPAPISQPSSRYSRHALRRLTSSEKTLPPLFRPTGKNTNRSATCLVYLPVRVQAKIILWNYMLKNRWRLSDLARLLGVTQTQAQRLVDLDRDLASMEAIEDAFRAIGGAFSLSEKNPGAR